MRLFQFFEVVEELRLLGGGQFTETSVVGGARSMGGVKNHIQCGCLAPVQVGWGAPHSAQSGRVQTGECAKDPLTTGGVLGAHIVQRKGGGIAIGHRGPGVAGGAAFIGEMGGTRDRPCGEAAILISVRADVEAIQGGDVGG